MILLIDNYDSFTYNLVHLISGVRQEISVVRNDKITVEEALAQKPDAIVLSPGPCTPNEAGICLDLIAAAIEKKVPLFGVCLGHQSIAQACGASVIRTDNLMHGKTSEVTHGGDEIFTGLPDPFTATRYHSLIVDQKSMPETLVPLAYSTDDREVMAIRVKDKPVYGVQFHPESIATEGGATMIWNFLRLTLGEQAAA